ncbi:MAG: hypothetical protein FOGNACKC_04365 [Anaerolineae bacterium]|nr:hypothetical protein [Anaerolineae bacterium]
MKKLLTILSLLVIVSMILIACGGSAPATEAPAAKEEAPAAPAEAPAAKEEVAAPAAEAPLFVAINKSADQQYFIDLQNSFIETATGLGAQAKKFDAKLDPGLGVSLVNDAISAGAKGIAITVPDQTIGPAIMKAATDAGVVLIATDDGIVDENGNPVPFVGFDGKDMGKKVGEAAAKLLTDSGWLADSAKKVGVLSVEVQTLSVCNDRTDNEKAAIIAAGVPENQVFAVPYTGEALSAQDAAGPIITANPDITNWVVFGCNDEGVLGTLNALATAGANPDDIIGVGLGAYEACKFWAADQPSGFKAGLFISGLDVGKTAATVLYDAVVKGTEPPASTFAPTTIVDPTNFTSVMDPVSLGNCGAEPAAAPAAASGETPLFVAINKSADQQYFIDLQNSFIDTATGLGAEAKKFDAKLDPNLGVSLVNDAISAGAKGIAITVPDQTIGPAISQAAKDAGVVLIATDDGIVDENGNPVPFVGFDGKDMGKKVGEAAATLLTDSGWLADSAKKVGVLSVEVQTLSVCNDRTDNEKAAIIAAGVPEDQVFAVPYTGEALSAQDAAGPIITANPDITNWVVFGCNDEGVLGTLNALATAGANPDDIIGVGLGAYEACKFWAADQPSGFKAGLFISGLDVGKTAATVLYEAVVKGTEPPASTFAPTTIVDPTNFTSVMDSVSLGNCGAEPAAAPAAASGETPLFVAINKSADQQYFIDLQNSFIDTATGLGAEAKKFDAKLDPNLGVSLVNDAISAGAKGIAITVPDQTIGPAISQAAKDAGVVLIATDDGIVDENGNPVPFVGFDGKDMGKKVGEAAATLLTDSGWLADSAKKVGVLSVEVQTLSVCNDRTDNEKAAIIAAGVPENQVFPVPYTGEALSAQDAAGPVITANPDITNWVVFGCNDEGVLGTLNALATAGANPDDIIGVGLGAYEACKFWAADQPSGFKAGLFISGLDVGKTAATVLYDAVVKGTEPPASTFAPTTIVDPTNYESVMDSISLGNCSQ